MCFFLTNCGGSEAALPSGFVASFCSKLSDTTASEVGKAYGMTTYMSTPPFTPVPRGTEGAVSAEGTAAGIAASLLFAGVVGLSHVIMMCVCALVRPSLFLPFFFI